MDGDAPGGSCAFKLGAARRETGLEVGPDFLCFLTSTSSNEQVPQAAGGFDVGRSKLAGQPIGFLGLSVEIVSGEQIGCCIDVM